VISTTDITTDTIIDTTVVESADSYNIALIGVVPFHSVLQKNGNRYFEVTIDTIDEALEQQKGTYKDYEETVRRTLPIKYHDLINVFSKKDLDTLSPRRKGIDLKIKLEKDTDPR
jgi:hypothetical protein